jgi:hypothetical protein
MGKKIRAQGLVLRCYGYQNRPDRWYGVCLDLNLATEAGSGDELKKKLDSVISSYIESVVDTDDKDSIRALLCRRAPLHDWMIYYLFKAMIYIRQFPGKFTFQTYRSSPLSHAC